MEKPILYNGYKIDSEISVSWRLDRLFWTEVYKLSNNQFLYLFLDLKENDIVNREIGLIKFSIKDITYLWIIVDTFNIKNLSSLKEALVSITWFDSIAGMDSLKSHLLEEIIIPFRNKEKFKKYKISLPNGLLFYWPPWCGKTYISTKLAEELGWNFMEIKHSDIASPYIHWTVERIRQVFEKAKMNTPTVLFIDEISWLVPKREDLSWDKSHKEEEINEFLINLDEAWEKGILVVWATNYPNKIDPAILRTWRFDLKIFIWPPDQLTRVKLFEFYLNWRPISSDIDYTTLSELTENYIASDIKYIVESTSKKSAILDILISMEWLLEGIKNNQKSISNEELEYYEKIYWYEERTEIKKIGFEVDY